MSDKFNPEKVTLIEFKIIKGQIDAPENFSGDKITAHEIESGLFLSFNLDEKLGRADFEIKVKTQSENNPEEALGNFKLAFIYHIENLQELAKFDSNQNNRVEVDSDLAIALASISYSTARGVLLTRFQGTALQNFILPVISANKLLQPK